MYQLIKLSHKKADLTDQEVAAIQELEKMEGEPLYDVKIGSGFRFLIGSGVSGKLLITSIVKSIYIHESDYDKLVLPSSFDMTNTLVIPELKEGDTMFATVNSVYLLRRVNENKEDKERVLVRSTMGADSRFEQFLQS